MHVGFIGLGDQGGAMARRIIDAGHPTTLWARRDASLAPYRDTAARFAASPGELAAGCDLVGVCVVDDAGVRDVVLGPAGLLAGMRPGSVIAVHSTVEPSTVTELADRAGQQGVAVLDAPVSGGGAAAAAGSLLVILGGDAGDVERCRPVFATFGDPVIHVGPVGSAQHAKLINNALLAANLHLGSEAIDLGRRFGLDPATLAEVLHHGSGDSYGMMILARMGGLIERLVPHAATLLRKDVGLIAGTLGDDQAVDGLLIPAAERMLTNVGAPRASGG